MEFSRETSHPARQARTGDDARDESGASAASPFSTIPEALEELRAGRFLAVLDDEDRENEGDLIMACETATPKPRILREPHRVICVAWLM